MFHLGYRSHFYCGLLISLLGLKRHLGASNLLQLGQFTDLAKGSASKYLKPSKGTTRGKNDRMSMWSQISVIKL